MRYATGSGVRIALVHYSYLPVIAGVELVMAEHARLFHVAGHEVEIVAGLAADDEGLAERLRPVLAQQDVVILHNVLIMHFHLALTVALWRLAEELRHVRFVCWLHDLAACNPDYAPLPRGEGTWDLLRQAHPRCTYVAVSELRRRQFLELTGQPDSSCRTIPNGVEPSRILDLPPRVALLAKHHDILPRDIVLVHPTRLLRRKNVELTLQVTAALKAAGHSCACLITALPEMHHGGSVEYAAEVRALSANLGLADEAHFLSTPEPLSEQEMHGVLRLADALFFPSRQEGFGIPVLEAALDRLPIFCSDIEPLNSLLTGGVTTFPLDASPSEIAALVATTLAQDRAYAARKETLRTYSWDAIYRNFLSPLLSETETH